MISTLSSNSLLSSPCQKATQLCPVTLWSLSPFPAQQHAMERLHHLISHYLVWNTGLCAHWRGKPWCSGCSFSPQGRLQGLPPLQGQELFLPVLPTLVLTKNFSQTWAEALHFSMCISRNKTVISNHMHSSPALLQVRFTPWEPQFRTFTDIPSHKSLLQLAKTRCYKSKTIPNLLHYQMKPAYSLMSLCNVQFQSSPKVVYKNFNPWVFAALF